MKPSFYTIDPPANTRPKKWVRSITALVLGAALSLAGCTTIVNQSTPFSESDLKSYDTTGTAVIYGHAFTRSDTGAKHGAAGITIYLVPLNDYTEERAKIMEAGNEPAPAAPRLVKYNKTTVGDWGGAYKFEALPPGKYLVYSKIKWEPRFGGIGQRDASGNFYVLARTEVSSGEHKSLVVTNVARK
jgi:hypothetical protein